jgi:hypothetical protein
MSVTVSTGSGAGGGGFATELASQSVLDRRSCLSQAGGRILAGTTRQPELSLKLWAVAHFRNLGSFLNWHQGYDRRRAVPHQPIKPQGPV